MRYFYNKASGIKADIKRHCEEEEKVTAKINALEAVENPTTFDVHALRIYRNILRQLLISKAKVVLKIGK